MIRKAKNKYSALPRGQTLLLSLLILAGVSAAGVGFATLIINQIKSAENIDNAITAFYAAQSGLERSLHTVKLGRQDNIELDNPSGDGVIQNIEALGTIELEEIDARVEIVEAVSEEESRKFFLEKDESAQIDLYDPDAPFGGSSDITHLWISWDNNPCSPTDDNNPCYGEGSEWVEISWTGWKADGSSYENVAKVLYSSDDLVFNPLYFCPEGTGDNPCRLLALDPTPGDPSDIFYYQVRVKALHDKVEDLEVKAINQISQNQYEFVSIPARVYVKTIGKYGRTQQALSASLPWRIPASGLLDYVVFTEKTLTKEPESAYFTSGPIEIEREIDTENIADNCSWEGINYSCCNCPLYNPAGGEPEPACDDENRCKQGGVTGLLWKTASDFEPLPDPPYEFPYSYGLDISCTDEGRTNNQIDNYGREVSGWTCTINRQADFAYYYRRKWIQKYIREEDLPAGDGYYYISIRALNNSNQNSEGIYILIENPDDLGTNLDFTPEVIENMGANDGNEMQVLPEDQADFQLAGQRLYAEDLFTSTADPVWHAYETCVSRQKYYLKEGYSIYFVHGYNSDSNHLDWYQFSTGVPPDITKKCDYGFNSGQVQIEKDIYPRPYIDDESVGNEACECDDEVNCNSNGECGNLTVGEETQVWNPIGWGDPTGSPYAQCYRWNSTTEFPFETGNNDVDWRTRPNEWGACKLTVNAVGTENRWIEVGVPTNLNGSNKDPGASVDDGGSYYLTLRAGFRGQEPKYENVQVDILDVNGESTNQTLKTTDLWGSYNTPPYNRFVQCTFTRQVTLQPEYKIKFSTPDGNCTNGNIHVINDPPTDNCSDTYIDWFQITDSPLPASRTCLDSGTIIQGDPPQIWPP